MPPKNVNPQSLNLNSLSREAIENLLSDLYEKFDNVRNFIDLRMTGQSDPLVKKFKKIIKNRLIEDIEDGINLQLPGGQNPPEKIIRQETWLAETNKKSQTTEENEMKADHLARFICVFISYVL